MNETDSSPVHDHLLPPARRQMAFPSILMAALFLLCGAVIGSTVTYYFVFEPPRFGPPAPGEMPAKIVKALKSELALSQEQAREIEAIFLRGEKEMDMIRTKLAPEMDAQRDKLENDVAALLRPEQVEKWRDKCNDMKKRYQARRVESGPATEPAAE